MHRDRGKRSSHALSKPRALARGWSRGPPPSPLSPFPPPWLQALFNRVERARALRVCPFVDDYHHNQSLDAQTYAVAVPCVAPRAQHAAAAAGARGAAENPPLVLTMGDFLELYAAGGPAHRGGDDGRGGVGGFDARCRG